jgi:hypothetical protein
MENKLTEQEIQRILKSYERELEHFTTALMRRTIDKLGFVLRHGRKPIVSASEVENLLDYVVERMDSVSGMVTRDFYNFFDFVCKENGVKNTMNETNIAARVKEHGYTIIDKKHPLTKKKVRMFIKT